MAGCQSQITNAETRYADLICTLIAYDKTRANEIRWIASDLGRQNTVVPNTDAAGIYKYFEDFFVVMPCDHVKAVTAQDEKNATWDMAQDIHAQYWQNGDSSNYYQICKSIMDGMLDGTDYHVIMSNPYHYSIQEK